MLVRKVQGDDLRRIADNLEPGLRDGFLTAAKQLKDDLPLNQMTDLIEAEDFDGLNRLVSNMTADTALFVEPMTEGFVKGGQLGATEIGMSFNIQNPAVARWAETNSGLLVTNITTQTQQTVATMVADSVRQGVPPRRLARNIRTVVGLTERDAKAVRLFHEGLLEGGASNKFADAARDRMAAKRLRNRAINISRTESIRAANQGQLQAWTDARDEGLIPATAQRVWIAGGDTRVCPICLTLDGDVVELVGDYSTGDRLPNVTTAQLPPAHPQCRCTTGLLFEGDEGFVGSDTPTPDVTAAESRDYLTGQGIEVDLPDDYDPRTLKAVADAHRDVSVRVDDVGLRKVTVGRATDRATASVVGQTMYVPRKGFPHRSLHRNVIGGDAYSVVVHELAHTTENAAMARLAGPTATLSETKAAKRQVRRAISDGQAVAYGDDVQTQVRIVQDLGTYANTNSAEFFGEVSATRHNPAVWDALTPDAQNRIVEFGRFLNDRLGIKVIDV